MSANAPYTLFQVGDVVTLKSGGTRMTVSSVREGEGGGDVVKLAYVDRDGVMRGATFQAQMLCTVMPQIIPMPQAREAKARPWLKFFKVCR